MRWHEKSSSETQTIANAKRVLAIMSCYEGKLIRAVAGMLTHSVGRSGDKTFACARISDSAGQVTRMETNGNDFETPDAEGWRLGSG